MTARCRLALCALACAACLPVSPAAAAGPPLPSADSGDTGAVAPGGTERLVTRRAGDDTVVSALRRGTGRVLRSRRVPGHWAIPAVTLDGGTTGLSADGRTLVLARPTRAFPPPRTRLAVLDVRRLRVTRTIRLPGLFTIDAIAPDGRWAYVVQYSGGDPLDYRVRALDTATGRLAARDVVDPREPGERMAGLPLTRAVSADGRWAYTLYGGGAETFIHALDTVGRAAACVDLDMLAADADLSSVELRLARGGGRIDVRDGGALVATVDTRTFAVTEPGAALARHGAVAPPRASDGTAPAALWLGAGALALAAGAFLVVRRRARVPAAG